MSYSLIANYVVQANDGSTSISVSDTDSGDIRLYRDGAEHMTLELEEAELILDALQAKVDQMTSVTSA